MDEHDTESERWRLSRYAPPEPTEGEWTADYVADRFTIDASTAGHIADAHNAALAAEREKCEKLMTDGISERNWSNHLRIQLAAEVEKVNKLQEQLAAEKKRADEAEAGELREAEQLAAERAKVATLAGALQQILNAVEHLGHTMEKVGKQ